MENLDCIVNIHVNSAKKEAGRNDRPLLTLMGYRQRLAFVPLREFVGTWRFVSFEERF